MKGYIMEEKDKDKPPTEGETYKRAGECHD